MKPIDILLVEDNEGDIELTTEAFQAARVHLELRVARNGEEALDVFRSGAPSRTSCCWT